MSFRLLAVAVLLGLAGCGPALDPQLVAQGREAYVAEGCHACHGRHQGGTVMGPDLRKVSRHWKLEELTAYLADPASHRQQQARLERLSRRYSTQMPPLATLPEERRRALAAFLLSR
ncbi:MAG: cytochrome c [Acidobacteriota bacterium]|jgi:mono/diheme cytochrome c family protein